ncbi:MAG: PLDc N-terminal domain-containing protein [Microbacterium sp.]
MSLLFSFLVIALMIGALIDIITRDDSQVRFLPKMAWIIIVILLPLIGSVLWFTIGREYAASGIRMPRMPRRAQHPTPPPAPSRPVDTRTTEQQIADLDREIEEWRLREEIAKRKRNEQGAEPEHEG